MVTKSSRPTAPTSLTRWQTVLLLLAAFLMTHALGAHLDIIISHTTEVRQKLAATNIAKPQATNPTPQADWVKTATNFDAVVKLVDVKGKQFKDVKFNFPKGNEN